MVTLAAPWPALLLCLLLLLPTTSGGADISGLLRVGIFSTHPLNFVDKDGSAEGINPDLLRAIFAEENVQLAFVPGSWAEGLKRLEDGEIDMMMSVAHSEERAKVMDFGRESVLQLWGQVFTRPELQSRTISELFGRKIGVMAKDMSGLNFVATVKGLGGGCEIVEYPSHAEVFQAVASGGVDGGVAPQHFGLRHASTYNLVPTSILFSPFSIYFATKKDHHRHFLDFIDIRLAQWKKDQNSPYHRIVNHWMAPGGNGRTLPAWLFPLLVLLFVAILIATAFLVLLNRAVKRKTKELRASERRFRDIALAVSDWIWEIDAEGRYTFCSEQSGALLGYTPEELLGKSSLSLLTAVSAAETSEELAREVKEDRGHRQKERVALHKDGREIHLLSAAVPIHGNGGVVCGFRGVYTDISERIRAEQERRSLEEKLAQGRKMEAIGTLAGGIAHDFNNILSAIIGYTELAKEDLAPTSETAQHLGEVYRAALRARDLVKHILSFSRQAGAGKIRLDPTILISEALKMLRPSLPATIEIHQHIERPQLTVLADPTSINQIVVNLCTNAFHAMEEKGGVLDIEVKRVDLSAEDLLLEPQVLPGPFVRLRVADSGIGIAPEHRSRIFDPYFTTKEMGKGTGMGLAIVHGLVHDCGGFITCYSQLGQGTVFHVYLPGVPGEAEESEAVPQEVDGGTERILFVDDETMIGEASRVILEGLGYRVRIFNDPIAALTFFREMQRDIDVVITDQTMPGMTGVEMAVEMLKLRPELPIILCSGYSSTIDRDKAIALGIKEFAVKPLLKRDLALLLRQVIATVEEKE
jgi:PAS domain S-box-containing protein